MGSGGLTCHCDGVNTHIECETLKCTCKSLCKARTAGGRDTSSIYVFVVGTGDSDDSLY